MPDKIVIDNTVIGKLPNGEYGIVTFVPFEKYLQSRIKRRRISIFSRPKTIENLANDIRDYFEEANDYLK